MTSDRPRTKATDVYREVRGVKIIRWNPLAADGITRVNNFGDLLGPYIVNRLAPRRVGVGKDRSLLTVGSILHFASPGDVVWGSGVNAKLALGRLDPARVFDVRAVRGPLTALALAAEGNAVPPVWGDPAMLLPTLFPESLRWAAPDQRRCAVIVVPNLNDLSTMRTDLPVVSPTGDPAEIIKTILGANLIVASSLHAIVIAEAYGIPARAIRSAAEPLFKYVDYYGGTGRDNVVIADSIDHALELGGVPVAPLAREAELLDAFPTDMWTGERPPTSAPDGVRSLGSIAEEIADRTFGARGTTQEAWSMLASRTLLPLLRDRGHAIDADELERVIGASRTLLDAGLLAAPDGRFARTRTLLGLRLSKQIARASLENADGYRPVLDAIEPIRMSGRFMLSGTVQMPEGVGDIATISFSITLRSSNAQIPFSGAKWEEESPTSGRIRWCCLIDIDVVAEGTWGLVLNVQWAEKMKALTVRAAPVVAIQGSATDRLFSVSSTSVGGVVFRLGPPSAARREIGSMVRYPPDLLLSVVVATHNVAPWIDDLLNSIQACRMHRIEVLVIDDHSTDETRERVDAFVACDPRFRLVSAHGRGGANARNVGLNLARGKYVAFADGDDIVAPGAYELLVESLEASGSDIAFGDWLKFSSTRTWHPTSNWKVFDQDRIGVQFREVPSMIRGRAVWNKVFRRTFLEEDPPFFPEVPRSNDIVPMTRLYLRARQIDILSNCVYLYRERPGKKSMSSSVGTDAATVSYFAQEATCAEMVARHGDEGLSRAYSSLIFEADSWVHLSYYLNGLAADLDVHPEIESAVRSVIDAAPKSALNKAAAHKRVLWALFACGEMRAARLFNAAEESARTSGTYDAYAIAAWVDAVGIALSAPTVLVCIGRERLVVDSVMRLFLREAYALPEAELRALVEDLHDRCITDHIDSNNITDPWLRATAVALRAGDCGVVRVLSLLARKALVVDEVHASRRICHLAGPIDTDGAMCYLVLRRPGEAARTVPVRVESGRWRATFSAHQVRVGRWDVDVAVAGVSEVNVAVVTARMPLPVARRADRFQVYSDRRRGWRVVIGCRPSLMRRAVTSLLRRVLVVKRHL